MENIEEEISLTEKLVYSTVRIETEYDDGNSGVGTGFFFDFHDDDETSLPVVITNQHVVEGADRGAFYITHRDDEGMPEHGEYSPVVFDNFEDGWRFHPDSDIDLAAFPIAPILHGAEENNISFFRVELSKDNIPSRDDWTELSVSDEILMIGYPNGIWDEQNNLPIVRRGITATPPYIDHEGKPEFMIDAPCFKGSSGSPVFLSERGAYRNEEGVKVGTRFSFLGILYAGPTYSVEGEIEVRNIETSPRPVAESDIPINLGYVIKTTELDELKDVFSDQMEEVTNGS